MTKLPFDPFKPWPPGALAAHMARRERQRLAFEDYLARQRDSAYAVVTGANPGGFAASSATARALALDVLRLHGTPSRPKQKAGPVFPFRPAPSGAAAAGANGVRCHPERGPVSILPPGTRPAPAANPSSDGAVS